MLINGKALRDTEFDIEWVGALSAEEYEAGKKYVPNVEAWWWLRSSGYFCSYSAHFISCSGVIASGSVFYYDYLAVRPALRIGNLAVLNRRPGDKVEIAGIMWTVISEELVLADEFIGRTAFNKDINKGNEYHGSDLEKFILTWWEKRSKG